MFNHKKYGINKMYDQLPFNRVSCNKNPISTVRIKITNDDKTRL